MGASDGYVIGLTKRLDHGPASLRWNVVVVAEGFQASEMPKFHNEVNKFIDKLFNTKPFNEMWCAVNVYSLDVASTESGADEPSGGECTGSGITRATYFDATFCSGGTQRALSVDAYLVVNTVNDYFPDYDVIVVLVNSTTYGGLGQGVVCTASLGFSPITGKGAVEIPIHEIGHSGFGLADEYPYDSGNVYSGPEPLAPDITANADKNTIKWKDLIGAATPVPTQSNPDCSQEDTSPSPVPAGTVGAFEGAGHYHCGLFRPEYNCQMRELGNPFCAVCTRVIKQTLQPFMTPVTVTLATPTIEFKDIPEGVGGVGVTTYRAAIFEVGSCAPLTLQASQPTGGFGLPLGDTLVVTPAELSEGKIWVSYTSTTAGATANGSMNVHSVETNEDFTVLIKANTVARPKSAVTLVLDHSGSMSEDAGDGSTKVSKLRQAAKTFVDVMLAGDGLGLVKFDDTAQIVASVDDVAVNGGTAKTKIDGPDFDPAGDTSIGAGLQKGSDALTNASGVYLVKAMAVLTDGMENTAPFMNDVSGLITANTFGIGFGTPANVDVGKLEILTGTHQGYLLITGSLTTAQQFRLQKYFVQILAGATNAEIVVDPEGVLLPGAVQKVPFVLAEPDYGADVILLAREPRAVDFRLETPAGTVIDAVAANTQPNIQLVRTPQVSYYRMGLPALPLDPTGSHGGKWYAILQLGKALDVHGIAAQATRLEMPYSLVVHAYSSLQFRAAISQSGYAPGSQLMLTATLSEYGVPVEHRATVWAEMTRPDGTGKVLKMKEEDPGRFTGTTTESGQGVYRFRVRAIGLTFRERLFTREQTLTAVIGAFGTGDPSGASDLCKLLKCLLASKAIQPKLVETLRGHGIEWKALADCLRMQCSNIRSKG